MLAQQEAGRITVLATNTARPGEFRRATLIAAGLQDEGAAQRRRADVARDRYAEARTLYITAGRDRDAVRIDDAICSLPTNQPDA